MMTTRASWIPVVLGLTALLISSDPALAQRGRPVYRAPSRGVYYAPRYSYPTYVYRSAYRPIWYGPTYVVPTYSYYYSPTPTYYYVPTPAYFQPTPAATATADIRVILLDPQAVVWFDDRLTSSTGTERLYHTPMLTNGGTYSYRIRATWMQVGHQVTQERVVAVTPGRTSVVDFTQAGGEAVPPPSPR